RVGGGGRPMHPSPARSVQGLPAKQRSRPGPAQVPSAQASPVVQASPSSQGPVLSVCPQPVRESHVSSVHGLPSSQLSRAPVHEPAAQASPVVHASPSLQGAVLGVCTHPVSGRQASSVQRLPSSQPSGAPPTHCPPAQVSCVVQALASSQGALLAVCTHPVSGRQASLVQRLPSSQLRGVPTHRPPAQVSAVVQASRA